MEFAYLIFHDIVVEQPAACKCRSMRSHRYRVFERALDASPVISTRKVRTNNPLEVKTRRNSFNANNGGSEIYSVGYKEYRLRKPTKMFKPPKNCEDSSDFDDFRIKRIVSVRPISGKISERTKRAKSFRNLRKFFEKCFVGFS